MTVELACAVLSYRDEPFLIEAVGSVLNQGVPIEVVVVNSGGGDPSCRLESAGLDVPVYNFADRFYPGAARNVGIEQTHAPYLAFLAADCLAVPGWAAARIREHRAGASSVASTLTNAYPGSSVSWALLLLLHNRRLAVTDPGKRLLYSLSYDRSLFDRFGRFREDLRAGEDTEFNTRIGVSGKTVLAVDAITAHRYPTEIRAMLRDAFRRGRLQALMQGKIEGGPRNLNVALRGPRNWVRALIVSCRSPRQQQAILWRTWPLVIVAGVAHFLGALSARRNSKEEQ